MYDLHSNKEVISNICKLETLILEKYKPFIKNHLTLDKSLYTSIEILQNIEKIKQYVYSQTYTNAAGCDSVHTLNLTIQYSNTGSTTASACDSYTWTENAGVALQHTGPYDATYTNAVGCDSLHTLNLTIQILKDSTSFINNLEIVKKNISINSLLHILLVDINCALWM
jgi:hypothetical protein